MSINAALSSTPPAPEMVWNNEAIDPRIVVFVFGILVISVKYGE
jgi:hypothetical protein